MYFWLGICLCLAALTLLNVAVSMGSEVLWHWLKPLANNWRAQDRARAIFSLRVAPFLATVFFICAFLLPAYLTHEPLHTEETVGWPMGTFAVLALFGFILAIWRGCRAWRATNILVKSWLQIATPIKLPDVDLPTFVVAHPFPLLAVVGIWKPKLFVAQQIMQTLTESELKASLRHELAHLQTNDNLKRVILRACSDVLTFIPCGRGLDRTWEAEAECAADEYAVQSDQKVSLELASALLKIARLALSHKPIHLPIGAYILSRNSDDGLLARRVRRLVRISHSRSIFRFDLAIWSALGCFLLVLALAAWQTTALATFHQLLEHIIAI